MKLTKEQTDKLIEQSNYPDLIEYVIQKAEVFDTTVFLTKVVNQNEYMFKLNRLSEKKKAEEFLNLFEKEAKDITFIINSPDDEEVTVTAWKVFTYACAEILSGLELKY